AHRYCTCTARLLPLLHCSTPSLWTRSTTTALAPLYRHTYIARCYCTRPSSPTAPCSPTAPYHPRHGRHRSCHHQRSLLSMSYNCPLATATSPSPPVTLVIFHSKVNKISLLTTNASSIRLLLLCFSKSILEDSWWHVIVENM
ncbi:unnamed protein product, partial [Musa hybrid cultivar]